MGKQEKVYEGEGRVASPEVEREADADVGEREEGTCAGCGVKGRLLKDPTTPGCLWCGACGGAGPE